jgi:DNA invertase Pin-like site-specific DNA recombinase
MTQFGYMSTKSAATSIKQQREAMRAAGFNLDDPLERVFCDDRAFAIAALDKGDELVVATAACLGTVASDVLGVLRDVAARGAAIRILDDNAILSFPPEAEAALDAAMKADHANRKSRIAEMRKARRESGKMGGKAPVEWGPKQIAEVARLESQGQTRDEIAKALGMGRATLMRRLRETSN